MKKRSLFVISLVCIVGMTGCTPKNKSGTNTMTEVPVPTPDPGTGGGVNNNGQNPGPVVPANCTGTSEDGTGDGFPLWKHRFELAGHQPWLPGNYTNSLQRTAMLNMSEASSAFSSDSRLKVRFKIHPQPFPTAGDEYCFGRKTGQDSDSYTYKKLRFKVHLRDIQCSTPNPQDPTKCDSALTLGDRYATQYIDPIDVHFCSAPIDIGALRNQTTFGTVIEIDDVKADSTCQANGEFCPAEKIVRAASCWSMTLQISTDYTQDFKAQ